MTVYLVASINVKDAEAYKGYSALVPDTLKKYGGWYVVRAGGVEEADMIEGEFRLRRFVVLAFESKEAALKWYISEEYQAAAEVRQKYSEADICIIDEVPAGTVQHGAELPTREWGAWH